MSRTVAPEGAIAITGTLGPPRRIWWLWLVTGIIWLLAALVILQFDSASVKTVGVIVGFMFLFAAAEQFVIAAVADRLRWLGALFGVLFLIFGIVCLANPRTRSPASPTFSASCCCSSACGGRSRRSWNARRTPCGGSASSAASR